MKMCSECGEVPLYKNNRSGYCRPCYERNRPRNVRGSKEYGVNRAKQKQYYDTNMDVWRRGLLNRFNLSPEQYERMLFEQNNSCAICKRDRSEFTKHFGVDHDHSCCPIRGRSCGKCVRGLLCEHCNHGLGKFYDDTERLKNAIAYLSKEL